MMKMEYCQVANKLTKSKSGAETELYLPKLVRFDILW
jgi:hypothetical protein